MSTATERVAAQAVSVRSRRRRKAEHSAGHWFPGRWTGRRILRKTFSRVRLRTSDPDEAAAVIGRLACPNRIYPLQEGDLDARLDLLRLGSSTAGLLSYGVDARQRTTVTEQFHVNLPIRGRAVSRMGRHLIGETKPGQAALFMPDHPADITWLDRCAQLCLIVPPATLEGSLERLLGRALSAPLAFESRMSFAGGLGRSWRQTVEVVVSELSSEGGLLAHSGVARQLEMLVVDGLLLGQQHNYTDALDRGRWRPSNRSIARAVELLEETPERPWSTTSLAQEVHLSVRTLQEGFAQHVGMPPMRYLKRVRLRRAHYLLDTADPAITTVAAVASRFGFSHLGRFSMAYREMHGESPSATLHKRY